MSKLNASDFVSGSVYVYCTNLEEVNKELLKALESLTNSLYKDVPERLHSLEIDRALIAIENAKKL